MTKHRFKSKTLPAISMVGPVTIWLLVFVAAPLVYVFIMSFCGLDEFYNVSYHLRLTIIRDLQIPIMWIYIFIRL